MNNKTNIHAAFVLAFDSKGNIASTTRDDGTIGLPGGKLDKGEDALSAVLRESREEGWNIKVGVPYFQTEVEGKLCVWFIGHSPVRLTEFKEKGRIEPVWKTEEEVRSQSLIEYKNVEALNAYYDWRTMRIGKAI